MRNPGPRRGEQAQAPGEEQSKTEEESGGQLGGKGEEEEKIEIPAEAD